MLSTYGFLRPSRVPYDAVCGARNQKYAFIVVGKNGDVYCIPEHSDKMLAIRAETNDLNCINLPYLWTHVQFDGVVASDDGCLYFAPVMCCSGDAFPYSWFIEALTSNVNSRAEYFDMVSRLTQPPFRLPQSGLCVLVFDTVRESFSHIVQPLELELVDTVLGADCRVEYSLFGGVAAADNGKVYCPPTNSGSVAVYDPSQKRISFIQGAGRSSQRNKWAGIAMAPDGHLFCAPARARSVLVINPVNDALNFIYDEALFDRCGAVKYWTQDEVSGAWKSLPDYEAGDTHCWSGIAVARNGKLYCAPLDSNAVLVIDPDTWNLSCIPLPGDAFNLLRNKWAGITPAGDGRLYCAPWCVDCILVIDPRYSTLSFIQVPSCDVVPCVPHYSPNKCCFQWCGIAASNDRIWCTPDQAEELLTLLVPKENLSFLLQSSCHFDLVIASENGEQVRCHQCVVASASRVLRTMLSSGFREAREGRICLKDVSDATIKDLVAYLYEGTLPQKANVTELTGLAHRYELNHLLALCLEALLSGLNGDNVVPMQHMLKQYSTASFESAGMWRIFRHIVRSDDLLYFTFMEVDLHGQRGTTEIPAGFGLM